MAPRSRRGLVGVAGLLVAALVGAGSAVFARHLRFPVERRVTVFHENPSTVSASQDAAALLQYLNDALQFVATQRLADADTQLSVLALVSISPSLRQLVALVGQEIGDLSSGTGDVHATVGQAQALVQGGRSAEARRVLAQVRQLLQRNGGFVQQNRQSLLELANRLGVSHLPAASPARRAYDRIQGAFTAIDARDRRIASLLAGIEKGERVSLGPLSTAVRWTAPAQAYPARPFVVAGVVTSSGRPDVPRDVAFDLDGRVLRQLRVVGRFRAVLTPPADSPSGEHALTILVQASGEYTDATATRPIQIVRDPLEVALAPVSTVLVPGAVAISGRVSSPSGPVAQARIEARLGSSAAATGVGTNGRFRLTLVAPLTAGLVGPERIRVSAFPAVPWEAPAEAQIRATVVNLWGLGLACALVPLAAVYVGARRRLMWGGRAAPPHRVAGHRNEITTVPATAEPREAPASPVAYEEGAPAAARVMRIYAAAVRQVEVKTSISLRSHMTLREFERAAALRLRGRAFARMTALAEFVLYSSGPIAEESAVAMRRLGEALDKELAGDRA